MRHADPMSSSMETLVAWSALATAVASAGLLVVGAAAWGTTRGAVRAARDANNQAKRDSVARTRPYVFVEVLPSLAGTTCYDLRVRNTGQSAAHALTLDSSDWPDPLDDVAESIKTMFTTPRTLPPNSSIRLMWRLEGNFTDGTKAAGMNKAPSVVTAQYEGGGEAYSDRYDIQIEGSGLWPVPEAGPNAEALKGEMKTFYRLGQVIARRLGELGR